MKIPDAHYNISIKPHIDTFRYQQISKVWYASMYIASVDLRRYHGLDLIADSQKHGEEIAGLLTPGAGLTLIWSRNFFSDIRVELIVLSRWLNVSDLGGEERIFLPAIEARH